MATPPTRVTAVLPPEGWASVASPKTSLPFDVQAGDLITILAITQHSSYQLGAPTWTGSGTPVMQQTIANANYCQAYLYTIDVTAAATGRTVTMTRTVGTTGFYSFLVTVWRNHGGLGVTGKANVSSGAPSLALTTQANSAVGCAIGDWNAVNAARTWRTINGAPMVESSYDYISASTYAVYTGYTSDVGAAGSKTLGLTAPAGQKYSIIGFEVLGSNAPPPGVNVGDTDGISDNIAANRGISRQIGDTDGISDAVAAALAADRGAADTDGISDAVTAAADLERSPADPAAISDQLAATADFHRDPADYTPVTDAVTTTQRSGEVFVSDTLDVLDDAFTDAAADQFVDVADSIQINDAADVAESFAELAEAFTIVDQVDTVWITSPVIADQVQVRDDIDTGRGSPAVPADSVGLEDQTTVASTRAVHAADTVPLEDSVLAEWDAGGSAGVGPDPVGVADTVLATRPRTIIIADTVLAIDTFTSLDAGQIVDARILRRRAAARTMIRWQARTLPARTVARIMARRWANGGTLARRAFARIIGVWNKED